MLEGGDPLGLAPSLGLGLGLGFSLFEVSSLSKKRMEKKNKL